MCLTESKKKEYLRMIQMKNVEKSKIHGQENWDSTQQM